MKTSYFLPIEKMGNFMTGAAMNTQEGVYVYGIADPSIKKLLPPPLELADANAPMIYIYIVNIREPTFAPWYLEGGIGVLAKYGDTTGVYFFNLQLSGPGALMGAFTGREGSGLPKKLCERIVVERNGDYGRCYMERKGVRLIDVELEIGKYNIPELLLGNEECEKFPDGKIAGGGCLLHKYRMDDGFKDMEILYYDSPTRYYTWEPASAVVKLNSSIDDPYGEIPLHTVIGAAWSKCDNFVQGMSVLYRYPQDKTTEAMQYLFTGRYDQSLLGKAAQIYETK